MQSERVTFLTTPENKAALDAYATSNGHSVGHVLREASAHYLAQPSQADEYEEALAMVLPDLEKAVAEMKDTIIAMREGVVRTCAAVDAVLAGEHR